MLCLTLPLAGKGVTVQCKKGKLSANNKGPGQNNG